MKIAVLGAGVLGVSTAHYLRKSGYEVTVIERSADPALACSYSNGAQLSYACSTPLNGWDNIKKAILWLGKDNAPLLLRPRFDIDMFKWLAKFIINSSEATLSQNRKTLLLLAAYSKLQMHKFLDANPINFDYDQAGIFNLYIDQQNFEDELELFKYAQKIGGFKYEVFTNKQALKLMPSLKNFLPRTHSVIWAGDDETGDGYKFTSKLAKKLQKENCQFLYNTEVKALTYSNHTINSIETNHGFIKADKIVVCLGAYSNELLKSIGLKSSIYPMKGYSLTTKFKPSQHFKGSIYDHQNKTVYTAIGDRLRIAGTAEFCGYDESINDQRISAMLARAKEVLSGYTNFENCQSWACLRPQTPDSLPLVGRTKFSNLYLNTGHGMLGWTLALGSSKLISDLIAGKKPELDLGFTY